MKATYVDHMGTDLLFFLNQNNFLIEMLSAEMLRATADMGRGQAFLWILNEIGNYWGING